MTIIEQRTMDSIVSACHKYVNDKETLRDKFAMAAISNASFVASIAAKCGGYDCKDVASYAYELADAMMNERKK